MARIAVVGAGAIGQWIAGRLATGGHDLTVVCRREAAEAITARGLRVSLAGAERTLSAPAAAVQSVGELRGRPPFDWILITVKAFDVEKTVDELCAAEVAGNVTGATGTQVVGFQNGVGSEEPMARRIGPERTWVCVVTRPIELSSQAGQVVEAADKGGLSLAAYEKGRDIEPLRVAMAASGLPLTTHDDYRSMKWSKLLLNMTANAACAITDFTPAELYADRQLFAVERAALLEAMAVMAKLDIEAVDLPSYPARKLYMVMTKLPAGLARWVLANKVGRGRGSKLPSLRLEMERPRARLEVDYLNGAVAEHGKRCGVATPVNEWLTATLNRIARGEVEWQSYRRNRTRFLKEAPL
jgi:2-dehydropantoate 2-reductase